MCIQHNHKYARRRRQTGFAEALARSCTKDQRRQATSHRPQRPEITDRNESSTTTVLLTIDRSKASILRVTCDGNPFGQPTLLSSSVANTTTMYDSILPVRTSHLVLPA